jgi:hypothetical protein
MVIFGGRRGYPAATYYNDTWAFDFNTGTWSLLHDGTGTAPSERRIVDAAYDPLRHRMIVFGGKQGDWYTLVNDTWAFDLTTNMWERIHDGTGTAPSPRGWANVVYQPSEDRLLLFGGVVGEDVAVNDTWAFDMSTGTWALLDNGNGTAPADRGGSGHFFDCTTEQFFIYGGREDEDINYFGDVWSFDPATFVWTLLDDGTGYGPSSRKNITWGLTSPGEGLIIFGGHSEPPHVQLNDTWLLNLETLAWEQIHDGSGLAPLPRHAGGGFYDPERGCLVTFGGSDGMGGYFSDMWALVQLPQFAVDIKPGSCPNPLNVKSNGVLPVALLGRSDCDVAMIDVETVRLEGVAPVGWSYEDVATTEPPDAEPCDCNEDGPDGYTDLTLRFLTRDIVEALGDVVDGEVRSLMVTGLTVDGAAFEGFDCVRILKKGTDLVFGVRQEPISELPESKEQVSRVTLSSVVPNPFHAETQISFALPTASHVRLVVYSASGRRIRTPAEGSFDAGTHTVSWDGRDDAGRRVASSVYFCRLEAAGETTSAKVIVIE